MNDFLKNEQRRQISGFLDSVIDPENHYILIMFQKDKSTIRPTILASCDSETGFKVLAGLAEAQKIMVKKAGQIDPSQN